MSDEMAGSGEKKAAERFAAIDGVDLGFAGPLARTFAGPLAQTAAVVKELVEIVRDQERRIRALEEGRDARP